MPGPIPKCLPGVPLSPGPYGCTTTVPEAIDRMRGQGHPSEEDLRGLLQRGSTYAVPGQEFRFGKDCVSM